MRRVQVRALIAVGACALSGCGSNENSSAPASPPPPATQAAPEPAPPAITSQTDPAKRRVLTATPSGDLLYRPKTISGEMGASEIRNIRWRTYGGPTAVGTGIEDGKRVTIRLREKGSCDGKPTYLRWSVQPVGSAKKPRFEPTLSPHLSIDVCDPAEDESY